MYLTAIGEEKGELEHGHHFSEEQVAQYLKKNGQNSLPNSYLEGVFFNFQRTIKEFFNDLIYEIKPFTRLLGVIFLFNLILFIWYLFKRRITL